MCFILFERIGLRPAARSPDFEKIKHIHWPKGLSLLLAPFFNNPKIVSSRVAFNSDELSLDRFGFGWGQG